MSLRPLTLAPAPLTALAGAALVSFAWACGALDIEAPRAEFTQANVKQCKTFEQLVPGFMNAIKTGKTEGLRYVVEKHLAVPRREGEPPLINLVLRPVLTGIAAAAKKPPEAGAAPGQQCAKVPPPIAEAHELCELRRALDLLLHEGKGKDALGGLTPSLEAVLQYITGGPKADGGFEPSHYQVSTVLGGFCAQDAICQFSDTLDLLSATVAWLEGADGKAMLDHIDALVKNPSVSGVVKFDGLTETDFVALADFLIGTVQSADPATLDKLLTLAPFNQAPNDLKVVIEDVKKILNPAYRPNVIGPMKAVTRCLSQKDTGREVVRMLYRVAVRDKVEALGATRIFKALTDLRALDPRGSMLHLMGTMVAPLAADAEATDAAALACRLATSTRTSADQPKSNAELALPSILSLLKAGLVNELVCAGDTLIWGCAGGAQPACSSPSAAEP